MCYVKDKTWSSLIQNKCITAILGCNDDGAAVICDAADVAA